MIFRAILISADLYFSLELVRIIVSAGRTFNYYVK